MEDDKIKNLFLDFQPQLTSDRLFMAQLQKRMEAIEIVKQQHRSMYRRNRIAVVVAALSGFITGVILTMLLPTVSAWISSITTTLPSIGNTSIHLDAPVISWLLMAAACIAVTIATYEIVAERHTHL